MLYAYIYEGEGEREKTGKDTGGDECDSRSLSHSQKAKAADRAAAVLRTQEKVKELKHKTACLGNSPLVTSFPSLHVSTDGCLGEAAKAFLK